MAHLVDVIGANDLLALQEADVAALVLGLAHDYLRQGARSVHPEWLLQQVNGPPGAYERGYPQNQKDPAQRALHLGWEYLKRQGLLIPEPGINGQNGHHTLSAEGQRVAASRGLHQFIEAARFPKVLLHPRIADDVWRELGGGRYDAAVFLALRAVEEAVRAASGYPAALVGVDLVRRAFGANGPLTNAAEPVAEQEALAHLFAGAIGYYKNPQSHRTVNVDPKAAREAVLLASHLMRMVDERIVAPAVAAATP